MAPRKPSQQTHSLYLSRYCSLASNERGIKKIHLKFDMKLNELIITLQHNNNTVARMNGCGCRPETWHRRAKAPPKRRDGIFIAFFFFFFELASWQSKASQCENIVCVSHPKVKWCELTADVRSQTGGPAPFREKRLCVCRERKIIYAAPECWMESILSGIRRNPTTSSFLMCVCRPQHWRASVPTRHTGSYTLQAHLFISILFWLCMIIGYWVNI